MIKPIEDYTQEEISNCCEAVGIKFVELFNNLEKKYNSIIVAAGMAGAFAASVIAHGLDHNGAIEGVKSAFQDIENSPLNPRSKKILN
jgi:hypothetical protein